MIISSSIYTSLESKEKQYTAGISFANFKQFDEKGFKPDTILCPKELNELKQMRYEKRKRDFLIGRYCAKYALKEIMDDISLSDIYICNGFFNQPVIKCSKNIDFQVSISHCESYGISIAFPNELMMGIDFEAIKERNINAIENQLTQREKYLISLCDKLELYTVMWTLKEAISKALKIGFTVPLSIFEIAEINFNGNLYNSTFVNFPQFQAISYIIKCYIITLVYPVNLKLTFNESFMNSILESMI